MTAKDRRGNDVQSTQLEQLWQLSGADIHDGGTGPLQVDLKAGSTLYGHQGDQLFAVSIPDGDATPTVIWNQQIEGTRTP